MEHGITFPDIKLPWFIVAWWSVAVFIFRLQQKVKLEFSRMTHAYWRYALRMSQKKHLLGERHYLVLKKEPFFFLPLALWTIYATKQKKKKAEMFNLCSFEVETSSRCQLADPTLHLMLYFGFLLILSPVFLIKEPLWWTAESKRRQSATWGSSSFNKLILDALWLILRAEKCGKDTISEG